MLRVHQFVFTVSLLASSWLAMMAVHELGHCLGALLTGGHIKRVVLHPLAISRTDVAPNPVPAVVVWAGPIVGCLLPLAAVAFVPRRHVEARTVAAFFSGFCLIANGAYIAGGAISRIGDADEILRTGSPTWVLIAFGAITIPVGLAIWHRLGSLRGFIADPSLVSPSMAYTLLGLLGVLSCVAAALSPR